MNILPKDDEKWRERSGDGVWKPSALLPLQNKGCLHIQEGKTQGEETVI